MNDLIALPGATVQQALEALEYYRSGEDYQPTKASQAIAALRAALTQQAQPVAWTDAEADAARLAMELECLLTDKDVSTSTVSRWWKSAHEALDLHRERLATPPAAQQAEPTCNDRLQVAQQAEPKSCTWQQDGDSDSGVYGTSCGRYFNLDDGTPEDNKMRHCCYCGKTLAQELITEDGNE